MNARDFNIEINYYSQSNEENLNAFCEAPMSQTIKRLENAYTHYGTNFCVHDRDFDTIISYITFQLLRDSYVFRECKKRGILPDGIDERTFKNQLIGYESRHSFFAEVFHDVGIQFVFNKSVYPFLITSGTSTLFSDSDKYYIIQITLTPEIAVFVTNEESMKKALRSNNRYGVIDCVSSDWVLQYNKSIFLKATKYPPCILVSKDEKSILDVLQ